MDLICFNGAFLPAQQPVIGVDNHAYRWGEGLFETMKVLQNRLLLETLHYERLLSGMKQTGFNTSQFPSLEQLRNHVLELCRHNQCGQSARVRLSVFPEKDRTGFVIEAVKLDDALNRWPGLGQTLGVYTGGRKAMDALAQLKSSSYLLYRLAAQHATTQGWEDALVLNTADRIAESSRANLFIIRNDEFITPPLSEGCINGVMRRYLMESCTGHQISVRETPVTMEDLLSAEEIFLTNAIQGIRAVRTFQDRHYPEVFSRQLYDRFLATIYEPDC